MQQDVRRSRQKVGCLLPPQHHKSVYRHVYAGTNQAVVLCFWFLFNMCAISVAEAATSTGNESVSVCTAYQVVGETTIPMYIRTMRPRKFMVDEDHLRELVYGHLIPAPPEETGAATTSDSSIKFADACHLYLQGGITDNVDAVDARGITMPSALYPLVGPRNVRLQVATTDADSLLRLETIGMDAHSRKTAWFDLGGEELVCPAEPSGGRRLLSAGATGATGSGARANDLGPPMEMDPGLLDALDAQANAQGETIDALRALSKQIETTIDRNNEVRNILSNQIKQNDVLQGSVDRIYDGAEQLAPMVVAFESNIRKQGAEMEERLADLYYGQKEFADKFYDRVDDISEDLGRMQRNQEIEDVYNRQRFLRTMERRGTARRIRQLRTMQALRDFNNDTTCNAFLDLPPRTLHSTEVLSVSPDGGGQGIKSTFSVSNVQDDKGGRNGDAHNVITLVPTDENSAVNDLESVHHVSPYAGMENEKQLFAGFSLLKTSDSIPYLTLFHETARICHSTIRASVSDAIYNTGPAAYLNDYVTHDVSTNTCWDVDLQKYSLNLSTTYTDHGVFSRSTMSHTFESSFVFRLGSSNKMCKDNKVAFAVERSETGCEFLNKYNSGQSMMHQDWFREFKIHTAQKCGDLYAREFDVFNNVWTEATLHENEDWQDCSNALGNCMCLWYRKRSSNDKLTKHETQTFDTSIPVSLQQQYNAGWPGNPVLETEVNLIQYMQTVGYLDFTGHVTYPVGSSSFCSRSRTRTMDDIPRSVICTALYTIMQTKEMLLDPTMAEDDARKASCNGEPVLTNKGRYVRKNYSPFAENIGDDHDVLPVSYWSLQRIKHDLHPHMQCTTTSTPDSYSCSETGHDNRNCWPVLCVTPTNNLTSGNISVPFGVPRSEDLGTASVVFREMGFMCKHTVTLSQATWNLLHAVIAWFSEVSFAHLFHAERNGNVYRISLGEIAEYIFNTSNIANNIVHLVNNDLEHSTTTIRTCTYTLLDMRPWTTTMPNNTKFVVLHTNKEYAHEQTLNTLMERTFHQPNATNGNNGNFYPDRAKAQPLKRLQETLAMDIIDSMQDVAASTNTASNNEKIIPSGLWSKPITIHEPANEVNYGTTCRDPFWCRMVGSLRLNAVEVKNEKLMIQPGPLVWLQKRTEDMNADSLAPSGAPTDAPSLLQVLNRFGLDSTAPPRVPTPDFRLSTGTDSLTIAMNTFNTLRPYPRVPVLSPAVKWLMDTFRGDFPAAACFGPPVKAVRLESHGRQYLEFWRPPVDSPNVGNVVASPTPAASAPLAAEAAGAAPRRLPVCTGVRDTVSAPPVVSPVTPMGVTGPCRLDDTFRVGYAPAGLSVLHASLEIEDFLSGNIWFGWTPEVAEDTMHMSGAANQGRQLVVRPSSGPAPELARSWYAQRSAVPGSDRETSSLGATVDEGKMQRQVAGHMAGGTMLGCQRDDAADYVMGAAMRTGGGNGGLGQDDSYEPIVGVSELMGNFLPGMWATSDMISADSMEEAYQLQTDGLQNNSVAWWESKTAVIAAAELENLGAMQLELEASVTAGVDAETQALRDLQVNIENARNRSRGFAAQFENDTDAFLRQADIADDAIDKAKEAWERYRDRKDLVDDCEWFDLYCALGSFTLTKGIHGITYTIISIGWTSLSCIMALMAIPVAGMLARAVSWCCTCRRSTTNRSHTEITHAQDTILEKLERIEKALASLPTEGVNRSSVHRRRFNSV